MIADLFYQELKKSGFGPFVGVPCSILSPFLEVLDKRTEEFIATSEGEAMGIASGLYLAGKNPVVFMQNSGFCNALNPLTSLNLVYKIPVLTIVTLRGELGTKDAPQHKIMGKKIKELLNAVNIEYKYVSPDLNEFKKELKYCKAKLKKNLKPIVLLLRRNILEGKAASKKVNSFYKLNRQIAIKEISKALDKDCLVVSTTGKISREYYFSKGRPENNFYMTGSMGCASAIALGLSIGTENKKKVVILDGDGATLMKMGNLATIGNVLPRNLIHIVLDNQAHESTGGQATVSTTTQLGKVAKACGYPNVCKITKAEQIYSEIKQALKCKGPSFLLIKMARMAEKEDCKLGRVKQSSEEIKTKFMNNIRGGR